MRTEFDNLIGRLDRVISELMIHRDNLAALDPADLQTLKHHAEDMAGAGASILKALGGEAALVAKREPQVGDRVRVTATSSNPSGRGVDVADIGTISMIDPNDSESHYKLLILGGKQIYGWAKRVEVLT